MNKIQEVYHCSPILQYERGELTNTLKIKRNVLNKNYAAEIEKDVRRNNGKMNRFPLSLHPEMQKFLKMITIEQLKERKRTYCGT